MAAEVSVGSADFGQLGPMITPPSTSSHCRHQPRRPRHLLGDAGFWHGDRWNSLTGDGMSCWSRPTQEAPDGAEPGWDGGRYGFMRRVLDADAGGASTDDARR